MVPGLMHTVPKCVEVEIVVVKEGGKEGVVVGLDGGEGGGRSDLPPSAASAEPGSPSFAFENVESVAVR
jgi:leucyl-tRNA synthetase